MLDANWLNALKLPTKALTGLFIASIILLIFDKTKILDLSVFGSLIKPSVILICTVSGALSFTAISATLIEIFSAHRKRTLLEQRRELRKNEQKEAENERKQKVLDRIQYLSKDELCYLADCLREKKQSFTTFVHCPTASMLMSKSIIYTPGGTHHQDYYPFVIYDFVWEYLLENKEQILVLDNKNKEAEK